MRAHLIDKEGTELGAGGFGVVFKQDVEGVARAVKWLKSDVSFPVIKQEAEAIMKLKHESLVEFLGVAFDGKCVGLVLELVTGGDLFKYLHDPTGKGERRLTAEMQKRWSLQITSGLEYLHSHDIVHRDMRSTNILLTGDLPRAKISNFGLITVKSTSKTFADATGLPCSVHYMAPELLQRTWRYSFRSDVYALGLVLYEIYTRKMIVDIVLLEDVDEHVKDPSVKQIIKQCIALERTHRPSCTEIIQTLQRADDRQPKEAVQTPPRNDRALVTEEPTIIGGVQSQQNVPDVASPSTNPSDNLKSTVPKVGERQDSGYNTRSPQDKAQDEDYITGMEFYEMKQYRNALFYLEKAADRGHTESEFRVAFMFNNAKGVQEDFEKAMFWYMRAAKKNHYDAMGHIGRFYLNGQGVDKDVEKAKQWYERALERSSSVAQCGIGYMIENGIVFPQDYTKAAEWYLKAAKQGYVSAQYNMGRVYEDGKGVTQDYGVAMEWYLKAANQGYAHAQCKVGYFYHDGKVVPQDYQKAMEWYLKAAEQRNPDAQFNLGCLYSQGLGVLKDYQKAMEWYLKAAEQGSVHAQNNLGRFYHQGLGVPKDYEKAKMWYQKSIEGGCESAKKNLNLLQPIT